MKKISALLVFVMAGLAIAAQTTIKKEGFAADRFSMNIPAAMDTMTADNIWTKYHKTPDGKTKYFSNEDISFSFVINEVAAKVTEADMVLHKNDLIAGLQSQYELTENEVITVNGHKIIAIAFSSDVPSGKIFNRRIFAVAGGKLLSVAFNTTEEDLEKRKAAIESSIRSIIIK